MAIIMYLGSNVKEYKEKSAEITRKALEAEKIRCNLCLQPMRRHSEYERGIKESGEKLTITVVWCRACKKWHALQPDFMLSGKHYSGNEIESVIIDSATIAVSRIDTEASESTVRRWIKQIGERIVRAVSVIKYLFKKGKAALSEIKVEVGHCYSELEQILEMAPSEVRSSGNKLGLANIWISKNEIPAYI